MIESIPLEDAFELSAHCSTDEYEFVADELYDQNRWTTLSLITFYKTDEQDEFYQFIWETGSTEYQEEQYNEDPMPVYPVRPVQTTVYRKAT